MATTITIRGDSTSAEAAIDDVTKSMERGGKASKSYATALDSVDRSLKRTTTSASRASSSIGAFAKRAASSVGSFAKSAGNIAAKGAVATTAVVGLGSAMGATGSSIAGVVAAMGPLGLAIAAIGTAVVGIIAGYKLWTAETEKVAQKHVELKSNLEGVNKVLSNLTAALKARRDAAKSDTDAFKAQIDAANRLTRSEQVAAKAIATTGQDRIKTALRLATIDKERLDLLREGASLTSETGDAARRRADIRQQLLDLQAEEVALQKQSTVLAEKAKQDSAEELANIAARGAARQKLEDQDRQARADAATDFKKLQDEMNQNSNEALDLLKQQTAERRKQLGLLFQAKDAEAPLDGAAAPQPSGGRGGGPFGLSGLVGGALGSAFGGAGGAVGNIGNRLGRAGVAAGGGRGGRSGGGDSGRGVLDAAKLLTDAEIDQVAKRAKVDSDIVEAMRAQLAAAKELDAQQEQMARDQKQLKALADAILNKARGRRQRSGR